MPNRRIRHIIRRQELLSVTPKTPVREAARLMDVRNVASVLVLDADGRLLGIFTERDLLRRVVAKGRDPDKTLVAEVMTATPHTIAPEATTLQAMRAMHEYKVRHLPVTDGGRAVGVVSIRDFLGEELIEFLNEQEMRERLWEEV
jgi:CBS domain-containing protein